MKPGDIVKLNLQLIKVINSLEGNSYMFKVCEVNQVFLESITLTQEQLDKAMTNE